MNRVSRGSGFRGVLDYAFQREAGANRQPGLLIGGNMDGQTPRQLASEFGAVRQMREDIQKPVWHNSLRLPAGDSLTDEKWNAIAISYMKKMGFTEAHQYCVVLHNDEEGQHVHIIANRVGVNGSVYLGQNENLKSTSIISELEHIYGLTVTKGAEYKEGGAVVKPGVKALTKSEIEEALRTGIEPPRQQLQRIIDTAMTGKPTAPQFCERLAVAGVEVHANIASTGKLNGFSFSINGAAFKASDLGDRYKWANLSKEVGYEQARDCEVIQRYRTATPDSADGISDARANRPLTEAYGTHERISKGGCKTNKVTASAGVPVGATAAPASIQYHNKNLEKYPPELRIVDKGSVHCRPPKKIDWLDFNINDSTYYFKDKTGSMTPMVREVADGLQLVGRVAPSKCRAMLHIMEVNAWSSAVVSGGDRSFQETMLYEALKRVPLPKLRFTNADVELQYQAHRCEVISVPNPAFRLPHVASLVRPDNHIVR